MESDASMTYHRVNKRYHGNHTVSSPQYPTLNGNPMTSANFSHVMQETDGSIATVSNGNVFVNHNFQPEESLEDYQASENKM